MTALKRVFRRSDFAEGDLVHVDWSSAQIAYEEGKGRWEFTLLHRLDRRQAAGLEQGLQAWLQASYDRELQVMVQGGSGHGWADLIVWGDDLMSVPAERLQAKVDELVGRVLPEVHKARETERQLAEDWARGLTVTD